MDAVKAFQGNIEKLSRRERDRSQTCTRTAPEPAAKAPVEVILGVEAGVSAGLVARVALRAALQVDNQGLLMDLFLGGG